jgi:inosose dehydratase
MTIKVANAPVSWGIYEFEGIAPKYPFGRVLDEIAATGYIGTELGPYGYLPTEVDDLRAELTQRNMQMVSAFVPVNFADEKAIEAAEAEALRDGTLLAALGADSLILADDNGSIPELVRQAGRRSGSKLSAAAWDVYGAGVNRVARTIFDQTGLKVVFHHHCGGYVETPDETRALLDRTDADLVGLCLDTAHYHFGGGDALAAAREFGTRIRHLHLKGYDAKIHEQVNAKNADYFGAVEMGVFCELDGSDIDFATLIAEMRQLGYDGWATVEQDVLTDDLDAPQASAGRNRDYLRTLDL